MKTIINLAERQQLVENYATKLVDDLSPEEIRLSLIDYIYDDKGRMSNVALFAEINDTYPELFEE